MQVLDTTTNKRQDANEDVIKPHCFKNDSKYTAASCDRNAFTSRRYSMYLLPWSIERCRAVWRMLSIVAKASVGLFSNFIDAMSKALSGPQRDAGCEMGNTGALQHGRKARRMLIGSPRASHC